MNKAKKSPLISVIMPAYNHEKFIAESIESVLNQTFKDFEFIIINDGSTDRTEEVIRGYDDKRIRYYSQNNMDAPCTINRGISLAEGKYLSIINSDDVYHTDRLSYLLNTAEQQNYKFIFTDIVFINGNSEELTPDSDIILWHKKAKNLYSKFGSLYRVFLRSNIAVTSSNLFFHSSVPEDIGVFSGYRYVHDYDFIFRALCRFSNSFRFMEDKKLLYYRLHDENTINESFLRKQIEDFYLHGLNLIRFIKSSNARSIN